MKRIVVAALAALGLGLGLVVPAQTVAPVGPRMETLRGEQPIELRELRIDVRLRGGLAETTVRMGFYNPNPRPLEGNLDFPLLDGQQVTGFALDFDGRLRDAVAVEKQRGRQVFEAIERRNVDPALLEKTQGNNFRLRVYPVPARGTRTVVVRYSEALARRDGLRRYRLPLAYGPAVQGFELRVDSDAPAAPRAAGMLGALRFEPRGGLFRAQVQRAQFAPSGELELALPTPRSPQVAVERRADGAWFVAEVPLPALPAARRELPRRVQLLWDSSLSGAGRAHASELALLDGYLRALGEGEVLLQRLRDRPEAVERFAIRGGDWSALRRALETTAYDGASALGDWQPDPAAEEVLLVSDGLRNYGPLESAAPRPGVRLYAINASASADRDRLRALAEASGGRLVELRAGHADAALRDLLGEAPRVVALSGEGLADLHAAPGGARDGFVRVAGRLQLPEARLSVRVAGGQVVEVPIGRAAPDSPFAAREWAGYRIAALAAQPERHRAEVARLGMQFGLATSETSLIVLDRVEDYVEHGIAPPPELAEAYAALRAKREASEADERKSHLDEVAAAFAEKVKWWETPFPKGPKPVPKPKYNDIHITGTAAGGSTGSIAGRTSANATVVIENAATGFRRETTADRQGNYRVGRLPTGDYTVTTNGLTRTVRVAVGQSSQSASLEAVTVTGASIDVPPQAMAAPAAEPIPHDVTSVALLAPGTVRGEAAADAAVAAADAGPAITIEVKPWQADAPYLARLHAAKDAELYGIYLDLRPDYLASPGFFVDVAELLHERGQQALALRVLSNLAEIGLDQRALLRVLGYRLLQWSQPALAVPVFEAVLRVAEYEPQSFRDLGLAQAAAGHDQEAVDALAEVVLRPWDTRFAEIELITLADLNAIVARAARPLDTGRLDPRLLRNLPLDLRVLLNWDADDSDMDLWVTDPNGEKCYYGFQHTYQGGRMSDDFTQGYGPEEFSLRDAKPGRYKVEVHYYADRQQSVAGPTTLQVRLQTGFGTPAAKERIIGLRLKDDSESVLVGEFEVE